MNLRESYFIIPPNKNSDIKEIASQLIKLQYIRTHRQLPAACSTVVRLLRYISVYIQQIHHLYFMGNLVLVFLKRVFFWLKKPKELLFFK